MLRLEHLYWLVAAFLAAAAIYNLRERRWSMAAFWAVLAMPFVVGDAILGAFKAGTAWPAQLMGFGVLALGVLASRNPLKSVSDSAAVVVERAAAADRLGNRLFVPALAIPGLTALFYFGAGKLSAIGITVLDPKALTLTALGAASVLALFAALRVTRAAPTQAVAEGRRLLDALSWAVLLPMVLATLGGVFAATGVGSAIAALTSAMIPIDNRMACLAAFALGMIMFTVIMGNAFAAFPVIMAGIGLPLLVLRHGADPAVLGAIGMLTGYCGTLLTPMAANFNIVPAVLLDLPDPYAVIRAQMGTALVLMLVNFVLMAVLVFR